jgi:hypothetical protein
VPAKDSGRARTRLEVDAKNQSGHLRFRFVASHIGFEIKQVGGHVRIL